MSFFNPFRRATPAPSSSSFPGDGNSLEEPQGIKLVIKHDRERYNVPIARPDTTPLSTLLATLAQQTGVPADQIKLVYNGAVLKGSHPISAYHLVNGSTLVLVGKNAPTPADLASSSGQPVKAKEVMPTTENGLVDYIKDKRKFLEVLMPDVEQYKAESSAYLKGKGKDTGSTPTATTTAPPAQTGQLPLGAPLSNTQNTSDIAPSYPSIEKSHRRISELLLQGLLKLDSIEVPSHFQKARLERKEGVKVVQRCLDEVDELWSQVKQAK